VSTYTFCDEEDSCGKINEMVPCAEGVSEGEMPPLFEGVFSAGAEAVDFTGVGWDEDG